MLKNFVRKRRDYQFRNGIKKVPVGVEQYQSMEDTPVFIITTEGSYYQLDTFRPPELKRLDCKV
ncbi:MAG: hypothetical protein HN523_10980 [Porticoccaceae bacterium]|jgi:hypothetical protein|nr:hypothetical protein [Porticoccaceae bacterium]